MLETDKKKFRDMLRDTYAMHSKDLTAGMVKIWIAQLGLYSIEAIEGAFDAYWRTARALPLPSDILKFLPDPLGHMGPEEAWNHAPKSERDGGYVTDQIMTAIASAADSIERGDMIGARMAFVEAYKREVGQAQAQGIRAKYWYSIPSGLNHGERLALKEKHTLEAAERKWLDPQKALNLLSTICDEQGKPSEIYRARLQNLSATPLQLTSGLKSAPPKLRLVSEGVRRVADGDAPLTREEALKNLPHLRKHYEASE